MKNIYKILFISCLVLCGCSSRVAKDEAIAHATDIAEQLNEGKTDEVYALFTEELKEEVAAIDFGNSFNSRRSPLGEFKQWDEPIVKYEDDMAACFLGATYENGMLEFQIVFDKELQISGLFVR